jgi:hypothetical protein
MTDVSHVAPVRDHVAPRLARARLWTFYTALAAAWSVAFVVVAEVRYRGLPARAPLAS